MPTFALNFSRPGNQIAAQYYNFLRLGFEGYRRVQQASRDVARYLADAIASIEPFELITDGSELPVFAFTIDRDITNWSVFDLSERLRDRGWLVPAYTLPREPPGPRGAADRRAQRLLARPRRAAARRPQAPRRLLRPPHLPASRRRQGQLQPLTAVRPLIDGPGDDVRVAARDHDAGVGRPVRTVSSAAAARSRRERCPGSDLLDLDLDVDARRQVEALERLDRLARRLDDVEEALVDPHLEVLARVLVDVG